MTFLAERWRHGRAGGLELGARHGAWCLGCCWALMAVLFAVGLMLGLGIAIAPADVPGFAEPSAAMPDGGGGMQMR